MSNTLKKKKKEEEEEEEEEEEVEKGEGRVRGRGGGRKREEEKISFPQMPRKTIHQTQWIIKVTKEFRKKIKGLQKINLKTWEIMI